MTAPTAYGMKPEDALWLAHALRSAASLHWPSGLPPVIAEQLGAVETRARAFYAEAEALASILLVSDVEGIEGETVELDFEGDDEEDEDPRPWEQ